MGLDGIWSDTHDYLTKKSKGFHARSTGCSCCSCELETEEKVKEEAIRSLEDILLATAYFKWDFVKLITKAKMGEKYLKFKAAHQPRTAERGEKG